MVYLKPTWDPLLQCLYLGKCLLEQQIQRNYTGLKITACMQQFWQILYWKIQKDQKIPTTTSEEPGAKTRCWEQKQSTAHALCTQHPKWWAEHLSYPSDLTPGHTPTLTPWKEPAYPPTLGSKQGDLLFVFHPFCSWSSNPSKALPEFLVWPLVNFCWSGGRPRTLVSIISNTVTPREGESKIKLSTSELGSFGFHPLSWVEFCFILALGAAMRASLTETCLDSLFGDFRMEDGVLSITTLHLLSACLRKNSYQSCEPTETSRGWFVNHFYFTDHMVFPSLVWLIGSSEPNLWFKYGKMFASFWLNCTILLPNFALFLFPFPFWFLQCWILGFSTLASLTSWTSWACSVGMCPPLCWRFSSIPDLCPLVAAPPTPGCNKRKFLWVFPDVPWRAKSPLRWEPLDHMCLCHL